MFQFLSKFQSKRPFKLTGAGWVFILYTIGVGAGAINTGNNLLYLVFGVFLGLMLASGFLSDLSLWAVDVSYTLPHAAAAGEPMSILLAVENTKRRVPSISVIVTIEGKLRGKIVRLRRYVPYIAARGLVQTRFEWSPPERGQFELHQVRLSTRYPFGLLEKWWRLRMEYHGEERVFVTPNIFPVNIAQLPIRSSGNEREDETRMRGESATLLGLRSYAHGDNPRRIHWRATAKRAPTSVAGSEWLVREMGQEQKEEIVFRSPELHQVRNVADEAVERFVAFFASAVRASRAAGYDVAIALGGHRVLDEAQFFATWNPRQKADAQKILVEAELLRSGARAVDVWEAYHVQNAR